MKNPKNKLKWAKCKNKIILPTKIDKISQSRFQEKFFKIQSEKMNICYKDSFFGGLAGKNWRFEKKLEVWQGKIGGLEKKVAGLEV